MRMRLHIESVDFHWRIAFDFNFDFDFSAKRICSTVGLSNSFARHVAQLALTMRATVHCWHDSSTKSNNKKIARQEVARVLKHRPLCNWRSFAFELEYGLNSTMKTTSKQMVFILKSHKTHKNSISRNERSGKPQQREEYKKKKSE